MGPGPSNLITDVPGLQVGNALDEGLKTGVTCLTAAEPFTAGVSILGGAPGTRETALLAPERTVQAVDAVVLTGGSAFGLDAAAGVVEALHAAGRGFAVAGARVPIVPAAVIFDLANGGAALPAANPYRALGARAYGAAGTAFDIGTAGAGAGATTARLKGGLGSASARLSTGATVGALAVVNPAGCVTLPDSRHFWAWAWEQGAEFGGLGPPPTVPRAWTPDDIKSFDDPAGRASTTLAVVATDLALDKAGATRLADAAQAGIARATAPCFTLRDGDLVFAVSTGAIPVRDPARDLLDLGHAAAVTLSRAIARGVYAARPSPGDRLPVWSDLG